jgi:hypothetical protein
MLVPSRGTKLACIVCTPTFLSRGGRLRMKAVSVAALAVCAAKRAAQHAQSTVVSTVRGMGAAVGVAGTQWGPRMPLPAPQPSHGRPLAPAQPMGFSGTVQAAGAQRPMQQQLSQGLPRMPALRPSMPPMPYSTQASVAPVTPTSQLPLQGEADCGRADCGRARMVDHHSACACQRDPA